MGGWVLVVLLTVGADAAEPPLLPTPAPLPGLPLEPAPAPAVVRFDVVSLWVGPALVQRDVFATAVQLNFALHELAGVTFSIESSMPAGLVFPFYAVKREAENLTAFMVRLWFRSDERLQRNWLDR